MLKRITRKELIAWLETKNAKNAKKEYCYIDSTRCLLSQFLKARGDYTGAFDERVHPRERSIFYRIAAGPGHKNSPHIWTFGQALMRAKALA